MEQIDLTQGEEILIKTRRSWIVLVPALIIMILIAGIFIGGGYGLQSFIKTMSETEPPPEWISILFDVLVYLMYVGGGLCAILVLAERIVAIKCDYLVLTNKRLYGRKGFIAKSTYDMVLEKIDTVRVKNTVFGRIFHYASLEVVSPASTRIVRGNTVHEQYGLIVNTEEFRKAVILALERAKEEKLKQNEN